MCKIKVRKFLLNISWCFGVMEENLRGADSAPPGLDRVYYLFNCAGLKLISCWDLKEHHIVIIIIKNHKEKILIEFPESVNLEVSYFNLELAFL